MYLFWRKVYFFFILVSFSLQHQDYLVQALSLNLIP